MTTLLIPAVVVYANLCTDDEFLAVASAMMIVESGGDPEAVGDEGYAIGVLQIHKAYWEDVCRILGVDWPYERAKDPVYAITALWAYTRHYTEAAGIDWVPRNIARIHNGGPDGWKQACTLEYWEKIRAEMKEK